MWPKFLTSCLLQSFSLYHIKWGFKKSCPWTCPRNVDSFWRSSGGVTGLLMRNGQQDSGLCCKKTQGAQQALLFCFHVVSRTSSMLTIQEPLCVLCSEFRAFLWPCCRGCFLRWYFSTEKLKHSCRWVLCVCVCVCVCPRTREQLTVTCSFNWGVGGVALFPFRG